MIACRLSHLEARCRERGYTLDEVRACIVSQDGDRITVDVEHPAYPREPKPGVTLIQKARNFATSAAKHVAAGMPQASEEKIAPIIVGVGTELKKLLSKIGIKATPNCSCNKRAALMDTNGIEWCENNIDTIVGWLREEATKRKLPFVDIAGKILVKRAISNAKKRI